MRIGLKRLPDVPLVRQTESADCGLACLSMISQALGGDERLQDLRIRFRSSNRGMRLSRLLQIADEINLVARPLKVEVAAVHRLKTPCILHWRGNHFVVLRRVQSSNYHIVDPSKGDLKLSQSEFADAYSGVAVEFERLPGFEPKPRKPAVRIRELTGAVSGFWGGVGQVVLASAGLEALVLLVPFQIQWTIDHALSTGDKDLLTIIGLGFLAVLSFLAIAKALRSWLIVHFSVSLGAQWNANIFRWMVKLPIEYFQSRHVGDVLSRAGSAGAIQRTVTTAFVETVIDGGMCVILIAIAYVYSPTLLLLASSAVVIYAILRQLRYRLLLSKTEALIESGAELQSHFIESIKSHQSVKLMGMESQRMLSWGALQSVNVNDQLSMERLYISFGIASSLVFGWEAVLAIWIGAGIVLDGDMTVGMLIAFLAYKSTLVGRLGALVDRTFEYRMLRVHKERLADIVLSPTDTLLKGSGDLPSSGPVALQAKGVSFSYPGDETPLFENVDISLNEGEWTALVGASGEGKSTFARILLCLVPPSRGSILLAGVDTTTMGSTAFRSSVGGVLQGEGMLDGTLLENITCFEDDPDIDRVEQACRIAGINEEVAQLPLGLGTRIFGTSPALSGGQVQRFLIARAVYRQPRVLILDEATSNLDPATEERVLSGLRKLPMAVLMITHRPETLRFADVVIELSAGSLKERSSRSAPETTICA